MSVPKWGGRRAQEWSAAVLARYGTVCHLRLPGCTFVATTGDHLVPRSVDLERQYDVANGRPACEPCNKRRKAAPLVAVVNIDDRAFFESASTPGRTPPPSPPRTPQKNDDPDPNATRKDQDR